MRPLSLDLEEGGARPYFLWNEDLTVDELRARLAGADERERLRLLSVLLREARDICLYVSTRLSSWTSLSSGSRR